MVSKEKISEENKLNTLSNISTYTDLSIGVKDTDLVVEAATENIDIKLKIFKQLDEICDKKTILGTNTSSISITKIASSTCRTDKVIGIHFMNPVPIMKLVEIIRGYNTSDETTKQIMDISKSLMKIPLKSMIIQVCANRILMPMINESIETLFQGVAGVNEIDTVMMLGMPIQWVHYICIDFIGLDVCLSILEVI